MNHDLPIEIWKKKITEVMIMVGRHLTSEAPSRFQYLYALFKNDNSTIPKLL